MDISGDMTCPYYRYTGVQYREGRTEYCDLHRAWSFEGDMEERGIAAFFDALFIR